MDSDNNATKEQIANPDDGVQDPASEVNDQIDIQANSDVDDEVPDIDYGDPIHQLKRLPSASAQRRPSYDMLSEGVNELNKSLFDALKNNKTSGADILNDVDGTSDTNNNNDKDVGGDNDVEVEAEMQEQEGKVEKVESKTVERQMREEKIVANGHSDKNDELDETDAMVGSKTKHEYSRHRKESEDVKSGTTDKSKVDGGVIETEDNVNSEVISGSAKDSEAKTDVTDTSRPESDTKSQKDDSEGMKPKKKGKRSEGGESSMRKENTCNVSVNTDRPILEDDAHLKVSYTPGKKGGNFGLPLGAKLSVPDGIFNKKDSITCEVAPPTQRWKYTPVLPGYEHLTSEIFMFSSTVNVLKKSVVVQIPYYPIDPEHSEINVKGKWKDENEWVDVGFLKKEGGKSPCVELEIDRLGIFVVTFTPKKEVFDVTIQGCLYNSRLSKYISIRFPKKAADRSFPCSIQINPISPDKVRLAKQNFPHDTNELLETTEFIDILPDSDVPLTFKRAVTVKLPLPAGFEESDEKKTDDIAVLQKTPAGWVMVDGAYKFTRTTVTFDVKSLSTFCVALSKPERKTALHRSITVLEGRVSKEMGEILVFINLQEKLWIVVLECCPVSRKDEKVAEKKEKGFNLIDKSVIQKEEINDKKMGFSSRKPPPVSNRLKAPEINGFEIFDGMKWAIEVGDDIKCSFESDYLDNKELQFFQFLPESYRRFVIEPKTNEEKGLIGNISFVPIDKSDSLSKFASTVKFKVEIPEEAVKAYFKPEFVPEEPKPEKDKPKIEFDLSIKQEEKKDEPCVPKFKPLPTTVMERLMRTSRKPIVLEKESKILSGKSLMTISRLVPEGLTLAVHLDLPDSTITGLGFDAISNGLGMVDVTYKILLYWKRQQKDKKDRAVEILSLALRDMGRDDIAAMVLQKHKENKDLTLDCFMQT